MTDTLRDQIAMTLLEHRFVITGWTDQPMCCACQEGCSDAQGYMLVMDPLLHDDHVADAILAIPGVAVVELPAKITTADELDALPFLTVIREIRPRCGVDYGGIYERRTSGWQCIAGTWVEPERNGGPTLPVMVLWRGKDEQ